jgi:hypothetical protein
VCIVASDDNASHIAEDNRYKFCDDHNILEVVMLGDVLVEYDFQQHVASDVGLGQEFLDPSLCNTQEQMNTIAEWTDQNLMHLNEAKCEYQIFSRARNELAARFTVNDKHMDRKYSAKVLGVWLEESGGWAKNTAELCRRAYAKMSMISKLKYAGVSTEELLEIYKLFVRTTAEYCSVAFHSSLTSKQSRSIEKIQSTSLKIIYQKNYISYEEACLKSSLKTLEQRRQDRCLRFSLKCVEHPQNKRMFPHNKEATHNIRNREVYQVNHANTENYRKSAIPYCQGLLNTHAQEKEERRRDKEEQGRRRRQAGD